MRKTRVIYQSPDKSWHPALLEGGWDNGVLILPDNSRYQMGVAVDRRTVERFDALCSAENLRKGMGLPDKMPLDFEWEGEFEGFRYKVFKQGEAPKKLHRFHIWCEDCNKWKPVGTRMQEKHLRIKWTFKAQMERMTL
jgi:hypothetical protein